MRHNYIVILILSLLMWTYAEELYSDKYDYVNIDEILANDRLRNQYYDCFIDAGSCLTPDSVFFKSKYKLLLKYDNIKKNQNKIYIYLIKK